MADRPRAVRGRTRARTRSSSSTGGAGSDFIDHVYTKFGEPDPDTGNDFGAERQSRKIIAWGGTTPDDEETGLGSARRQPRLVLRPLRRPRGLGRQLRHHQRGPRRRRRARLPDPGRLGVRARTATARRRAARGRPRLAGALRGDQPAVHLVAALPAVPDAAAAAERDQPRPQHVRGAGRASTRAGCTRSPRYLVNEESELFPDVRCSRDTEDLKLKGKAETCYVLWVADVACYDNRPQYPAFANLFLYARAEHRRRSSTRSSTQRRQEPDLRGAGLQLRDDRRHRGSGFLGYADDNCVDGTQSFVFSFVSPGVVDAGYGLTTTQIHESATTSG